MANSKRATKKRMKEKVKGLGFEGLEAIDVRVISLICCCT